MYVCICRRVTDQQVRTAIEQGARSLEQVSKSCRAGGDCGACHDDIEDLIGRASCATQRSPSAFGALVALSELALATV